LVINHKSEKLISVNLKKSTSKKPVHYIGDEVASDISMVNSEKSSVRLL